MLSQNVCWCLTAPVFMSEWRRVQSNGTFGQEFVAYVNGRFAKLYPEHDASRAIPGAHGPHA